MRPVRFGVYTLAGCIPWTAALGIAGYAVGRNWQRIAEAFHGPTYAIAGIVAVMVLVGGVVFVRRRRSERLAEQTGRPGHTSEIR
jgi:LPXTG-motif cell wall-anchored protein